MAPNPRSMKIRLLLSVLALTAFAALGTERPGWAQCNNPFSGWGSEPCVVAPPQPPPVQPPPPPVQPPPPPMATCENVVVTFSEPAPAGCGPLQSGSLTFDPALASEWCEVLPEGFPLDVACSGNVICRPVITGIDPETGEFSGAWVMAMAQMSYDANGHCRVVATCLKCASDDPASCETGPPYDQQHFYETRVGGPCPPGRTADTNPYSNGVTGQGRPLLGPELGGCNLGGREAEMLNAAREDK